MNDPKERAVSNEPRNLMTPTKLTAWLDCAHSLTLQRRVDSGKRLAPELSSTSPSAATSSIAMHVMWPEGAGGTWWSEALKGTRQDCAEGHGETYSDRMIAK